MTTWDVLVPSLVQTRSGVFEKGQVLKNLRFRSGEDRELALDIAFLVPQTGAIVPYATVKA